MPKVKLVGKKKRYRIQEKYIYTVWTYVNADSKEEAIKKIENDEFFCTTQKEIEAEHDSTLWDTLEEVNE